MSTVPHSLEPVHFSPQTIYCGDCLAILDHFPANCVDLIYIDPPFNSNRNYEVFWGDVGEKRAFDDRYGDAMAYIGYMRPRIEQLHRVLSATGSFYYHCDWHAGHYIKVMCDEIFGANFFRNEIVWCYSGGGVPKMDFPRKHDMIFRYSKTKNVTFNPVYRPYSEGTQQRGRTQVKGKYFEQGLREQGTPVTDWWTDIPKITSPTDPEKLGYPTQKSVALLERIIKVSSNPGDLVLDAFCGCGTALVAAQKLGRRWLGIDISPTSCNVMGARLEKDCGLRQAPVSLSAEQVAGSWDAPVTKAGKLAGERQAYYRFSNLPRSPEVLRALPGFEFENWAVLQLGEVLKHHGRRITAQVNRAKVGDFGLDGKIYLVTSASIKRDGQRLFGGQEDYIPIQVKNKDKAGRPDMDNFASALRRDERVVGFFIAWDFTRDAEKEVGRLAHAGNPLAIILVPVQKLIEETFDSELLGLMGV